MEPRPPAILGASGLAARPLEQAAEYGLGPLRCLPHMGYGEIIGSAFRITWRNRYLWFFGVFAGAGANIPTPNPGVGNFDYKGPDTANAAAPAWAQAATPDPGLLVAIGLGVLLLVAVLVVLSLVSQGALADSVAAIDRGGERRFGTAWKAGTRHFWRVLGLVALLLAIILAVIIVVGAPLAGVVIAVFSTTEALGVRIAVGIVAGLIALAALLLLFIPLQIVGHLALRELVLREERPVASLRRSYRLFRAHLGKTLLLLVIQIGIAIGATIALVLAALLVGLILFLPTIGLAIGGLETAAIVTGVVAGGVLVSLVIVAYGAVGAFNHAYWTLAYLRLGRLPTEAGT